MDTKDGSELHSQPSHYVVEEEYTVGVPLVRPKPAFLEVLRLAGATGEVFTKKEICSYLKEYIGSRQLYDVHDPRVVHCGHDRLGEVFRVDSFTINDVLDLLSKHCNQVPDTCLKRKRHLVTKPFPPPVSTHMQPGSLRIAVCRAIPQTLSPVITSTCSHRKSSTNCLPSSSVKSRKSSSSSSETKKSSKESSIGCADNTGDQATVPSLDGEFSAEKRRAKRKKRRNDDSTSEGSSKKQHFSEPNSGGQGMPGTSRRRGTSLSIMYGDDGDKNMFPWYFEVEVGDSNHDDDDKSEVLSLQGKETATVHDSTDDLWFLEEDSIAVEVNSDAEFSVEYDVESDISSIVESDISSVRSGEGLLVVCKESDVEFFADYSDSDSNSGDKELTEADNWICLECRHKNLPLQRYCDRCWKLRADWLPGQQSSLSEPRKQNGSTKLCNESLVKDIENDFKDSGVGSLSSTQPSSQEAADISLSNEAMFYKNTRIKTLDAPTLKDFSLNQRSLIEESQSSDTRHSFSNYQQKNKSSSPLESSESKVTGYNLTTEGQVQDLKVPKTPLDDPCMICLTKPKTASLIHGSSGHQVCCFSCAKRLKRRGKVCPVCRRPIQKVIKNYIL